jgi:3-deoxy-D-manno-octulosonic-acid transferase
VGEVMSLVTARGFAAIRRSELPSHARDPAGTVIVLDTVGELAQLYSIADVVFVGGSLAPFGGHNMLEPAARAKPVLFGPHTTNFREAAALLLDGGGARLVHDGRELGDELIRFLTDPQRRAVYGEAGHAAVAARHGAVGRTLDLIARYLHPESAA